MKDYYNAKDIKEVVSCGKSKAYEILNELIKRFNKEYPNAITIKGRIPIWYFEEIMMNKRVDKNVEHC